MADPAAPRSATALAAVRAAAAAAGLDATGLHVLGDANNTIVLLPRERLVAKVATSTLGERNGAALERELRIGAHLAARGAPIAPPAEPRAAGPHRSGASVVTFWQHREHGPEPADAAAAVGRVLRDVHAGLADLGEPLPALRERLAAAAALFADDAATPGLTVADRRLAARAHGRLEALLGEGGDPVALHGEPHAANVLWTAQGPLLVDFEAACRGPRAWDLAYLPADALASFPDVDPALVDRYREAVSFAVAAWCWAQPDGPPVVREAAGVHLGLLRGSSLAR